MAHTPEWKAEEMGSEGWAVWMPHPRGIGNMMIASNLFSDHARLIAGAPKMLKALKDIRQMIQLTPSCEAADLILDTADDAIAGL